MNEILDFIANFQSVQSIHIFTEGCCYWFAYILKGRFPRATIIYNPVENHFAVRIKGCAYDITGKIKVDKNWYSWSRYQKLDPLDAGRVYKNCILKQYEDQTNTDETM